MTRRRIFVLCEDSGKDTRRALGQVVAKALHLIAPGWDHHDPGITVEVVDQGDVADAWRGLAWTERKRDQKARRVTQFLREKLQTGDVVVLHHDGDRAWTNPDEPPGCDATPKVDALLDQVGGAADAPGVILRLVPHYSVESWLYLNRKALLGPDARPDLNSARAWLEDNFSDTTGYDHVVRPKEVCPLRSRYNGDLSQAWSAKAADEQSPSFRATLAVWRQSERLTVALARSVTQGS